MTAEHSIIYDKRVQVQFMFLPNITPHRNELKFEGPQNGKTVRPTYCKNVVKIKPFHKSKK